MAADLPIYAGSASFFVGDTPFGFYDNDSQFRCDAEKFANYAARHLGYPILDVELQPENFFAAFEAAVNEYGNQINTFAARDNIFTLMGVSTGSNINQTYTPPSLQGVVKLAEQYGSQVGAGGNLTWYSGSVSLQANKQTYDLVTDATIETGSFSSDRFTIRKVFHESTPSIMKYFDPYLGTGLGTQQFLTQFGWGNMSAPVNFMLMPLNYDIMRVQAIEFNEQIRKSGYSFQLTNNRLRIFPIPQTAMTLWFHYTLDDEESPYENSGDGQVSDISNIPYGRVVYRYVNELGRQWIRKYALATAKEMLGYIRGKYQNIPVPDEDTTLNYADLLSAAENEKSQLVEELREILDQMSSQAQLERKQAESDATAEILKKVPLKIRVG